MMYPIPSFYSARIASFSRMFEENTPGHVLKQIMTRVFMNGYLVNEFKSIEVNECTKHDRECSGKDCNGSNFVQNARLYRGGFCT